MFWSSTTSLWFATNMQDLWTWNMIMPIILRGHLFTPMWCKLQTERNESNKSRSFSTFLESTLIIHTFKVDACIRHAVINSVLKAVKATLANWHEIFIFVYIIVLHSVLYLFFSQVYQLEHRIRYEWVDKILNKYHLLFCQKNMTTQ